MIFLQGRACKNNSHVWMVSPYNSHFSWYFMMNYRHIYKFQAITCFFLPLNIGNIDE